MIIKKIHLKNIRSYENAEIELPTGSVLLSGDIGSGKTTVLLAAEFALFGLQPGQKGASLLRMGEKEGYVSIELDIDGKNVFIERTLKKDKSISQDYAAITIDGEKKETSVTELKNIILSLISYPPEFAKKTNLLYRFTVYTPQEEMKQIILEDTETRLNTLRHVFGIDKYKRIKENTSTVAIKLREEVRNKQGQIQDLDEKKTRKEAKVLEIDQLNSLVLSLEKDLSLLSGKRKLVEQELQEVEKKIKEKNKFENEIEKTKILLSGKKEMFSALLREEEKIKNQIEEAQKISFDENELQKLEKEREESKKSIELASKQYLDLLSQISSLNLKISDSEKLKSSIAGIKHCPTCLQDVSAVYKANIMNQTDSEISQNKNKISELTTERNTTSQKLDELKKKLSSLEDRVSELKLMKVKLEGQKEKLDRLDDISKQKILLEKDADMLNKHIENLKAVRLEMSKYDVLYEQKNKELELARKNEKDAEINLARVKKEIEMTKKEVQEITSEIERKEEIKKKLAYLSETEDWLSTKFLDLIAFTERNVMLKLKEEFSKLFSEWFNILVPETFSVKLDENFTPTIEQQDYELEYSFLSGGERTAVALAYRLALNQTINSLLSKIKTKDIVILDEPTDGFSEQQLDKMRDVLSQLKVKQLILVSHESKIESFVEKVIKFKKESGITIVES